MFVYLDLGKQLFRHTVVVFILLIYLYYIFSDMNRLHSLDNI